MEGNSSVRRSSRIRKAPARLVPGEGGGLTASGSHVSELDSVSEDIEHSADNHDNGEPSQSMDSDARPSSHETDERRTDQPSGLRSAQRRKKSQPRRPPSINRGRQTQDGAATASKRGRTLSASLTRQEGERARQADASSQGPGFQDFPQAALSALTAALLPSQFPASNLVSLSLFQEEVRNVIGEIDRELRLDECVDGDICVEDLHLPCHPHSAQPRGDPAPSDSSSPPSFGQQLEQAGQVLKVLGKRLESKKGRFRLRYREKQLPERPRVASEQNLEQRLSDDEILLSVGILRYGQSHRLQEFIVAGSQRLTDLRDALVCPADVNLQALGMAVPSAYFYIEGTFYSDLRAPGSLDYSEPVIKFCQHNSLLPPAPEGADAEARQRGDLNLEGNRDDRPQVSYQKADMHNTRFMDLVKLRVGSFPGYVFCHQGCCEHGLYFKDIRRIHPDDSHRLSDYPIPVYQAQPRRQRCSLCATRFAVKVTYEDQQAPEAPAFWCNDCYEAIHYDSTGKLKYAHKVFPYQMN